MPLNFSTTSVEAKTNGVKVCVFGASGVGKTVLSATAPVPIILSAEKGLLSLSLANLERLFGVGAPGITYDIPVLRIVKVQDLTDAHLWFLNNGDRGYFRTIILDSGSEIAEVVLANARATVKDPRQAYGELQDKMIATLKAFRDLPGRNVVVIAKEELLRDANGVSKKAPSMPGNKLGQALPYLFDEVFYLGVGTLPDQRKYRFLQTQPSMDCDAKDRSGSLQPMEKPDLTYLINKMTGVL